MHNILTDEALARLEFCALKISKNHQEEPIPQEELDAITGLIESLYNTVATLSLPDATRILLLEEVERIRHAVQMYAIRRAKGLQEALQSIIGYVYSRQEELKEEAKENGDVLKKLGELLDKLEAVTNRAIKLNKMLRSPVSYIFKRLTVSSVKLEENIEPSNDIKDEA